VPAIDFITAFGRLLRDASLRHAYASDPLGTAENIGLPIESRSAWLALDPTDLEFQAEVLLRKRFEAVSQLIPQTIANAGARAWPLFAEYARHVWPGGEPVELDDARGFCSHLESLQNGFIQTEERNRVRFAAGNSRVAFHQVADAFIRHRRRPCLQVFLRTTGRAWHELRISIG